MKRILTVLITVLITLVFAILSWSTFAFAGSNDMYGRNAGTCGDSVKWKMDDDGNMTIYGTGPMKNYCSGECPSYCGSVNFIYIGPHVKTVTFEDGVTSVGTYALTTDGLGGKTTSNVESVTICSSITSIGESAFNRNSVKNIYIYSKTLHSETMLYILELQFSATPVQPQKLMRKRTAIHSSLCARLIQRISKMPKKRLVQRMDIQEKKSAQYVVLLQSMDIQLRHWITIISL